MRNVSNAFRNELYNDNRNYIVSCDITFSDGTKKTVTNAQIWSGGFKVEDSVSGSNNFEIGAAIVGKLTLVLNNIYDDYSDYDFYGAEISNVKCGLKLPGGTTESVRFGKYTVDEPKYNGSIITLTCLDNMSKFDRPYSESNLTYPATLGQIVRDACNICDVLLASDSATFDNDDYVVDARPDDNTTFREVLSWVGQISCHWLKCNDNGQLTLNWYNASAYDKLFGVYDAGNFNDDIEKDTVDAGTFANPADGDVIDFGTFSDSEKYHHIYSTTSTDMSTDDVTITGIRVTERAPEDAEDQEDIVYQYGEDGYVLGIEGNELIQSGKGSQVASYLGGKIVGLTFRPLSLTCLSDPTIEAGDIAVFTDRKGRAYKTLITSTTFQAKNYQKVSCDAESPSKKNASRISKYTKVYQDLKNNLNRQKTAWQQAIEDLDDRLTNSSGLYSTIEKQEDGSNIYYLHDKPTLEESEIVWKMTAEAWGVSTNGGETWNGGMTVDGDVIARILTSIGVNADWINTGALVIQDADGNIMFRADVDTGIVDIVANTLSIRGKTVEEIAQDNLSDYVDAVFDPTVANLQAQIDGQIETWFYNYVPTTSNAPASQWTTDTEKEKHLGDLFYIVDNEEYGGQAYRWAKINNAYAWDYVEDTATTKALADAAKAQDTADSKRRVFISTPVPPYDVGDLWVGDTSSDLMRCQTARQSGTYVSTDWIKAVKYTDDSALNTFISGEYSDTIEDLQTQADQKAETWYQATDPSSVWSSTDKQNHKGDLWYNTTEQKTYIYNGSAWEETKSNPPDEVFDTIDGKAQIYVNTPVPPYNVGDLWFNSSTSDIMTCINARSTGSYTASDWQKRNKYTDDSALNNFIENEFSETIDEISNQIDGKAETWYQSTDPSSSWTTTALKNEHVGDIWYNTTSSVQKSYRWDGTSWQEMKTTPPDEVFDQIDGKAQIFISQPAPPYNQGDLWFNSASSDIMTCITSRESGSYVAADWQKRNKYVDQSTVNNAITEYDTSLGQTEVFNKLTNGGQTQGIYIQNGKLYINADYILSGTVAGQRINAKGIKVLDSNNNTTFEIDSNGNVTIRANTFSLQGSTIQNIANNAADSALTSANNYTDNKASSTLSSAQSYATNQANNAYNNSKNYTDNQLANFNPDVDLSQQEIFNILTNNGQTQGIYLSGGRIYINATYIDTGNLAGWNVNNTTLSSSSGYNSATLDGGNGRVRTTGDYEVFGGPGYAELYGNRVYADMGRFYSLQVDGSCSSLDISGTLYVSSTVTFPSVYNNTSTTTNQVVIGTAGKLFRKSSSSRRYKNHVRNMDFSEANKLYELPVVWFVYKDGYLSDEDRKIGVSIPGFYAEDVDKYLPDAADYIEDDEGNLIPENWDERTLIPYMVKCIQTQHEEIETLKSNQQKILQALANAGIEVEL